jgi:hypothetical protein
MMTVRAKFVVKSVERVVYNTSARDPVTRSYVTIPGEAQTIKLEPVSADGNPENAKFYAATPSGNISLTVVRKDVGDTFDLNKMYYVDFTEASD